MNRNQRRMAEYNARKAAQQIDAGNYAGKINRAFAKLSGTSLPRVEQALRAPSWREPKEESSGACLPQVALYAAGNRTVRKDAVHIIK
ncbi:hypothetical protein [Buttiauxella sp.]|uniref:transcriptional antitermination N peptide n=1 Tax=Buttiauxella sp. TaxID=1972222 RepID=UPI003C788D0A